MHKVNKKHAEYVSEAPVNKYDGLLVDLVKYNEGEGYMPIMLNR